MHRCHSSGSRLDRHPAQVLSSHRLPFTSPACPSSQSALTCTSCYKEPTQSCASPGQDWLCPVCLQTASFPVQTNCGHLFCAPCLMAYWRHGSWLDAISCPLCRQKVSALCHLFTASRSDQQSKEVLGEITDYNKRYSGAPRRVTDYLYDAPILLQLLARGVGTMGGLVWLFFLRVALCCLGTVMALSGSPLETIPSTESTLETAPSLCGLLGVLDDVVVVVLLLTCVININQQMAPERRIRQGSPAATPATVMGSSMSDHHTVGLGPR